MHFESLLITSSEQETPLPFSSDPGSGHPSPCLTASTSPVGERNGVLAPAMMQSTVFGERKRNRERGNRGKIR